MATISDYKVGDQVIFGRSQGEQTLGEVVRLGRTKLKVKQLEQRGTMRTFAVGTIWTVPPSLCRKVDGTTAATPAPVTTPKRPEAEILRDIMGCYSALSPENLHCDGEISRAAAARKAVALNARLRALFAEIGRRVSEDEAYRLTTNPNAPMGLPLVNPNPFAAFRRPSAREAGFKRGDKVQFKDKSGTTIVGFVRQANLKSISVDPIGSTSGRYWRVSPTLLTKVA